MRGKRRDWRVLVLVAMALAGIGVWRWLQRRAPADQAPEALPAPAEPVAIPVGEPMRAPVAVGATASSAASATAPMAASGAVAPPPPAVAAPPPAVAAPAPGRITRTDDLAHPFGPRSAPPSDDGGGPKGWVVKGNADSGLYHTPSSPSWKRMRAEAWFEDEAAAEAAGFTRWDWRRTAS